MNNAKRTRERECVTLVQVLGCAIATLMIFPIIGNAQTDAIGTAVEIGLEAPLDKSLLKDTFSSYIQGFISVDEKGEYSFNPVESDEKLRIREDLTKGFNRPSPQEPDALYERFKLTSPVPLAARVVSTENGFDLGNAKLPVVRNWEESISERLSNVKLRDRLSHAISEYNSDYLNQLLIKNSLWRGDVTTNAAAILDPPATLKDKATQLQRTIDDAFFDIVMQQDNPNPQDAAALLELSESLEPELFATFGTPILVDQAAFKKVYDLTFSVGSMRAFSSSKGTCFLVGTNLALTCAHVLEKHVPFSKGLWTIRFPSHQAGAVSVDVPVKRVVLDSNHPSLQVFKGASGEKIKLDFALVEFEPSDEFLKGGYPVFELSGASLLRIPVYLLGYPQSHEDIRISDDSRIVFPYDMPAGDFRKMLRQVGFEFFGSLFESPSSPQVASKIRELRRVFSRNYRYDPSQPDEPRYFYVGANNDKWKGFPTIGLRSDTSPGNSGGPVISKKDQRVYGLFRGGFTATYQEATWRRHERAQPILEIIRAIEHADPKILDAYGVQIRN